LTAVQLKPGVELANEADVLLARQNGWNIRREPGFRNIVEGPYGWEHINTIIDENGLVWGSNPHGMLPGDTWLEPDAELVEWVREAGFPVAWRDGQNPVVIDLLNPNNEILEEMVQQHRANIRNGVSFVFPQSWGENFAEQDMWANTTWLMPRANGLSVWGAGPASISGATSELPNNPTDRELREFADQWPGTVILYPDGTWFVSQATTTS